jgi:hypothetical protein
MRVGPTTRVLPVSITKHSTSSQIKVIHLQQGYIWKGTNMQHNTIIQGSTRSAQYNTCIDKQNKTHYSFYRIYMHRGMPCSKEILESMMLHEVVPQAPLQQPSFWAEKPSW